MRRSGGLGRGLAALLPDGHEQEPHPVEHHFPARPAGMRGEPRVDEATEATSGTAAPGDEETNVPDLGTELVAELATNQSGLGIIYRALDGLVESYALHDAAIVIEEPGLGRQVFRAGRKPLDDAGGEALLDAAPGLYTDPPLEAAAVDASLLTSLCVVALRMEVLR